MKLNMRYFDYETVAREAAIPADKLDQLVRFFTLEQPDDGMDYVEKRLKDYEAKVLAAEARLLRKLAKKQGFTFVPSAAK